ncbi:MAG: hypothetical protein WD355_09680 [Balneolaceae bacterium]
MDIFKLIFEHDLQLDALRKRHTNRDDQDLSLSIEAFMKPDPTYSRFYLTGTRIDEEEFGLNRLKNYPAITGVIGELLREYHLINRPPGSSGLIDILESMPVGHALLFSKEMKPKSDPEELHIDADSNVGHRKEPLRNALMADERVLYKEPAHHGFDLHLFSKENIYQKFFYPVQQLLTDEFRFFSINGKRIRSERQFYFETWALERPPHGIEEVFPETVL